MKRDNHLEISSAGLEKNAHMETEWLRLPVLLLGFIKLPGLKFGFGHSYLYTTMTGSSFLFSLFL